MIYRYVTALNTSSSSDDAVADAAAAATVAFSAGWTPPTAPLNSISSRSCSKPELSKETKLEESNSVSLRRWGDEHAMASCVSLRRRGDEHAMGSRVLAAVSSKKEDAVEVLRRCKTAPCLDSSDAGVVSKSELL